MKTSVLDKYWEKKLYKIDIYNGNNVKIIHTFDWLWEFMALKVL